MELLHFLESIRSPFLDVLVGFITRFGEETIAIVIICVIYWCLNKRLAYGIGIAYFLSGLTVQGMKISFRVDRPWIADPTLNPVPSALEHATGYSFPSGHTQGAAALLGSIGAQIKRIPLQVTCFTLAILVAFSRLYLGVHTLQDVAVSLLITALIIFITVKFFIPKDIDKKRELLLLIGMIFYAVIIITTAAILYSNGTIEQIYLTDCLKAAGACIGFATGMYVERIYICFSTKTKSLVLQFIKFIIGIAGVLLIKEGLKLIIGTGLVVDTVRYFLILIWMTVGFPLIIKRFFQAPS